MTNGLPWEDVMKDQTEIHIAALELQWQARERELLTRNTQLVERVRVLEEAARDAYWKLGESVGRAEIEQVRKKLAEVLAANA